MWLVKDVLDWLHAEFMQADLFYGHGTDNAWDEAVQLVLTVMQLPITSGEEVLELPVSQSQLETIKALTAERINTRCPLPYLLNRAWFMQLPFYVDQSVLIPRSPLGEWIACQFRPWVEPNKVRRILEIGTGSGCIAIACAKKFPNASVVATDIDPQALEVARRNVADYKLERQVTLLQADAFNGVPQQQFDIILSNPPYVPDEEYASLPAEYEHEPRGALVAAEHGLAVAIEIIREASHFLTDNGILIVEVGNTAAQLDEYYQTLPIIWLEQAEGGHGLALFDKQTLLTLQAENT